MKSWSCFQSRRSQNVTRCDSKKEPQICSTSPIFTPFQPFKACSRCQMDPWAMPPPWGHVPMDGKTLVMVPMSELTGNSSSKTIAFEGLCWEGESNPLKSHTALSSSTKEGIIISISVECLKRAAIHRNQHAINMQSTSGLKPWSFQTQNLQQDLFVASTHLKNVLFSLSRKKCSSSSPLFRLLNLKMWGQPKPTSYNHAKQLPNQTPFEKYVFVKLDHETPGKDETTKTGWWLNQPIWKICSSNWNSSPNRDEHQKYLSCHHLVLWFNLNFRTLITLKPPGRMEAMTIQKCLKPPTRFCDPLISWTLWCWPPPRWPRKNRSLRGRSCCASAMGIFGLRGW